MIKSMTGFASLTREDERAVIGVTARAVNHRYLDVQLRLPPGLSEREPALRAAVQKLVTRGRIEVSLSLQSRQPSAPQVDVNAAFLAALQAALADARRQGLVEGALTPGDLLRIPHAITIRENGGSTASESLPAELADVVQRAIEDVVSDLDRMRVHEGRHLFEDLHARRLLLADLIEQLAARAADGAAGLQARLTERVRELTVDLQMDRSALAQEIVRTAARSDISEEVTRFRAHLRHWDALCEAPEPCGRKLDFLLQEMNREVNTIGSKADGLGVAELIVTAKAELERMREQVQNVE